MVRNQNQTSTTFLRWISVGFIFAAVLLAVLQLIQYSRIRSSYPPGLVIAGVPVGGLDQQQASQRLVQAYSIPVEIRYGEAVIQVKPAVLGFELDQQGMLAEAELQRVNQPFWAAFWDYLWNRIPQPTEVPLRSKISEERLRLYLNGEIAPRYDQPAAAAVPLPGSTSFQPGRTGTLLDIDRAVVLIEDALRSPSARTVNLTFSQVNPTRPSFQNLQVLLNQVIDLSHFEGISELYLLDLQTNQELHFAYQKGKTLPPDISFTAASTIKIPIMISTMRRVPDPAPKDVADNLAKMVEFSENDPADRLMEQVMDKVNGPLEVAKDMTALGMKNTFLAGYFYPGATLLKRIATPGNQRKDYNTDPDPYNQTSPVEIGQLLDDIYQCAESGGGAFAAVFPGEISQNECKLMINYLILNRLPVLITAGLPEGTTIAHKHGWIMELDGLVHTFSDAAIVYTPGGNYILTIYTWNKDQLLFDTANQLVSDLSRAVYNYFNPAVQSSQ
jgi:beta-lactamase class A